MSAKTTRGCGAVVALALVAALAAPAARAAGEGTHEASEEGPAVGSVAPDFTLHGAGGEEVHLASFRGERPVVLIFFRGTW